MASGIDTDENRLEKARSLGATATINNYQSDAADKVMKLTNGRGVDTAIEAVGVPDTFALCEDIVTAGGTISNIGVHGVKVDLHLEKLWSHNVTITTRLVDTITTSLLLKTVESKKIDPKLLVSHYFDLDHILEAYDTFAEASSKKALKIIISCV